MSLDNITGAQPSSVKTQAVTTINPIVAVADVEDATHPINDATLSGKKSGSVITVVTASNAYVQAVAQGAGTTDSWLASDMVTTYTPA